MTCPVNDIYNWHTKVSYFCREKQGIMWNNLPDRNFNTIKMILAALLLSLLLFEYGCSATGKSYKRYQQVPCPCMKNNR
jgi:hypothetical protein